MREGFALAESQRYLEAIKVWSAVAKLQPGMPEVHSYLCFAHIALADYASAKTECELELHYRPHSRTGRFHTGLLYEFTGEPEKSKAYYQMALDLYPRYPAVLKRLSGMAANTPK